MNHSIGFLRLSVKGKMPLSYDYRDDGTIDLPMHADMLYDAPYEDEVKVQYREFVRQLLKRVKFSILAEDIGQLSWKNEEEYHKNESTTD